MNQFANRVSKNIKRYRKEKNITLKELADRVGLTEATIQKYEAGNIKTISIDMLKKLSDSLEVLPEDLTEWSQKEYDEYNKKTDDKEEVILLEKYSQLTHGYKKAVMQLIDNLIESQS